MNNKFWNKIWEYNYANYFGAKKIFDYNRIIINCKLKMDEVLRKLNREHLINNFNEQKISPDIVCKLSLQELEMLGITNKQNVMSLRIACSTFSKGKPIKLNSVCGAPKFFIPKGVLESWLDEDFTIAEISNLLGVSESTVYRRMREYELSKLEFTDISDQDLDNKVSIINSHNIVGGAAERI